MPGTLPPILPTSHTPSSLGGNGSVGHAQNFHTTTLQQHRDRANAAVSAHQAIQKNHPMKSSSIFHARDHNYRPTSSIAHAGQPQAAEGDGSLYDADADDRRYEYMQRKIRARKAKEAAALAKEAEKLEQEGRYKLNLPVGFAYTKGGAAGFHKHLGKFMKKYRSTYGNVSKKDREFFENILEQKAATKRTGSTINRQDRRQMRKQAWAGYKSGKISKEDYKDFKTLIGNM